jgi:hypothetical protein
MDIFIAYRRDDSHYITDRIYEELVRKFGKRKVFKDVASITYGHDFRRVILNAVGRCDVLLAVIGDKWLSASKSPGSRRIDDPKDFVRVEIEAALERDIPIIPLLVLNATMPREDDLPPSLKNLAYHNGMPVRPDPDFEHDLLRLIKAIFELPPSPGERPRSPLRQWALTATVLTSLFALILLIATWLDWPRRLLNMLPPSPKGGVVDVQPNVNPPWVGPKGGVVDVQANPPWAGGAGVPPSGPETISVLGPKAPGVPVDTSGPGNPGQFPSQR